MNFKSWLKLELVDRNFYATEDPELLIKYQGRNGETPGFPTINIQPKKDILDTIVKKKKRPRK